MPSEPDPLTPPEVQGPPPTAPGVAAGAAPALPTPAAKEAAKPDPVVEEVRRRLGAARGREASGDTADRNALVAFYAAEGAKAVWTSETGLTARAEAAIAEIRRAEDWGLRASAFDVPSLSAGEHSVQVRADAEIKLGLAILRYARHARGGRIDPQTVSKMLDRRPQVYEPQSLIQAVTAAEAPDAYLRDLHPRHAGFRFLQKALVAARAAAGQPVAAEPPPPEQAAGQGKRQGKQRQAARTAAPASRSETVQRIIVNMERWRWMPDDLGSFHVWNNVPDQMTTVYKDGQPVFHEKIVVGKPETPTPNFSADMQFVIFQPEWGVPNGIKNNEIGPLLRRASENSGWFGGGGPTPSAVLARHGLRVVHGGQVVNPDAVNWSSVDINRFSFIQPAGPANVLGVVKFRFPNKHDVYMHDTPQRHLFSAPVRAYSHGCMRVQDPVRFAEVLLAHDKGWASDRVRGMVPRGGEVRLSRAIPVHSVYFTAIASEDGTVRVASDLYGMDGRLASALEGRAVAIASQGAPVTAEPPAEGGQVVQRVRGDRQARQQQQRRTQGDPWGFGGNPFAGLFGN